MTPDKERVLITKLALDVQERLGFEVEISAPAAEGEAWFLDVLIASYRLTVEYSPGLRLFGLSTNRSMGDSSEEIYAHADEVLPRVVQLAVGQRSCTLGIVSHSAYDLAVHELSHQTSYRAELQSIVQIYESKGK